MIIGKGTEGEFVRINKKIGYFLIILIGWLPYWWAFFPIIMSYDGVSQLSNFFGGTYPNNHQPYTAAFLMGCVIKLFRYITNDNTWSFALYALIIGSSSAFVFSRFALKLGTAFGKKIGIFALLFFALFPLFPFYAFSYDKTSPFLIGIVLMLSALVSISKENKGGNNFYELIIGSVLVSLFRADGYYVVIILLFVTVIFLKSKWLLVATFSLIVTMIIINKMVFPFFYVSSGLPGDSISVPLQQIAYTVGKHKQELEKSEIYNDLNDYMPMDKITAAYNPNLADYVKFSYGNTYHNEQSSPKKAFDLFLKEKQKFKISNFFKYWVTLGMQYPLDYSKAWFYQIDSYYRPTNQAEKRSSAGQLFMNLNKDWVKNRIADTMKQLNLEINYNQNGLANQMKTAIVSPLKNSNIFYVIFLSAWIYDWTLILASLVLLFRIIKKQIPIIWILPILLPLGVLGVSMLSPVDGGLRYILPIVISFPMNVAIMLGNYSNFKRKKEFKINKKSFI